MKQSAAPKRKRERLTREDRRERIFSAAAEIALEEGAKAISIERIAAELGVTKGLLYQHFESRELLLAALAEREIKDLIARRIFNAAQAPDFEAAARAVLSIYFSHVSERGSLLLVVLSDPNVVEALSQECLTIWTQAKGATRKLVKSRFGLTDPVLGDAVSLIIALVAQAGRQVADRLTTKELAEDLTISMILGGLTNLQHQTATSS
jgi:AcrR family transcriptional regulator